MTLEKNGHQISPINADLKNIPADRKNKKTLPDQHPLATKANPDDETAMLKNIRSRNTSSDFLKSQFIKRRLNNLVILIMACLLAALPFAKAANAAGLIRDAEAENLIRDYSIPILQAAGLSSQNISIHIINDKNFNAFVVDGRNMFINMGAIMQSKTPNQLIGVMAHEAGHIAGGHLSRLRAHAAKAQTLDLMLKILGGAMLIAGGAGGGKDLGKAGQGIFAGSSYQTYRSMNQYRQTEEYAADQAAFVYLTRTKQSAKGMIETFEYFASQAIGSLKYSDPYVLSHPLPRARINQLREKAERSPYFNKKDPPALQLRHDMVRAKLVAFTSQAGYVYNRFPNSDQSRPARYARAIATFRSTGIKAFLPKVNKLLAEDPNNPYLHELKGQFLLESGNAKAAIPSLQKSVNLAPRAAIIRIMLAQAISQQPGGGNPDVIINHLKKALVREKRSAIGYRLLANAYGRKRMIGEASLASAHAYFFEGKLQDAKMQAKRAQNRLKKNSPKWIQANDILSTRR